MNIFIDIMLVEARDDYTVAFLFYSLFLEITRVAIGTLDGHLFTYHYTCLKQRIHISSY